MVSVTAVTKTDAAYAALRQAIESGELKPGERLPIAALEERLQMSPTPIREALRLLQADGLVIHRSHHGMIVAEYSSDEVLEIYRLRGAIESLATELAAERATAGEIKEIRRLHDEYGRAINRTAVRRNAATLNATWHRAIYEASHSRYLVEFIDRLWGAVPARALWLSTHAEGSAAEHAAITSALEKRDAQEAARLMRRHIEEGAVLHDERLRDPSER